MTAANGTHYVGSTTVGLSYLFVGMTKELGDGVVKKALAAQYQVPGETRTALLKTVRAYVTVDGFRNSEIAPPSLLQEPVSQWARHRDDLAGAVLKVWAESQKPLRERVDAYLRGKELLKGEPDYSSHRISVVHPEPSWNDAMDGLAAQNPDISREDLLLMSSYISGRVAQAAEEGPGPSDPASASSPMSEELSGVFQRALDILGTLSPDAPEWEQGVAEFVEAVAEIRERKQAEAKAVVELDAEVMAVAQLHADLLAFFEWDAEEKLKERAYPWADVEAARTAIERLARLLKEYATVHPMAAVRSDEAQRAPRRTEMQQQVDEALATFEALQVQTPPPPRAVAEAPEAGFDATTMVEPVQSMISEEELASLQAENERLAEVNRSLTSDNDVLKEQANQLSSELGESRNLAENWRLSYHDSRRARALTPVEPLPEFQGVEHAVQLARQRFGDRLSFQLIAKSDTSIPFDKPRQMWDALEWLATAYYDAKTGGNGETDLGLSLRQVCGWHYTPAQSPVTMGQYREYYEIWLRGRKRELAEHIGTGNGYNRGTIRVAFLWDPDEKKLVVGYIGRHQRTDAS